MFQTGIERRTVKDNLEQLNLRCPIEPPIIFYSLEMEEIYFPLSLFGVLIGVSFVILITERFKCSH